MLDLWEARASQVAEKLLWHGGNSMVRTSGTTG